MSMHRPAHPLVSLSAALLSMIVARNEPLCAQTTGPHDPNHAADAARWCAVHVVQAQLAEALSDCSHALEREPADVQSLSNRGSILLMLRKPSIALEDFNRALALRPNDARLHYNRGLAHGSLGEHEQAIVDYSEALRLQPDNFAALNNRGYEFERIGNPARALDDYEAALALRPDLAELRFRRDQLRGGR